MSGSSETLDPAFHGVGQKPGTEIWRIENFQPVPLPSADYGKFYSGDSYVVLQTTDNNKGAYKYDIHFWLGKKTSQDEAGTAAIKSVELDDALGGRAVQHREVQGHESETFLSYFKPCIVPLEGGFASGFKKHEAEQFENRLYICSGKRVVKMQQVPCSKSSLNHDDVFILDTEHKIYQFNGASSNVQERGKAFEVVQFLKDKYHEGTCDVAVVHDGSSDSEAESSDFWDIFGGFAPINDKVVSEQELPPEKTPPKLYSIRDGEVEIIECDLSKDVLNNHKCCLLDCGSEIYVWLSREALVGEKKAAILAAEKFVESQDRPKSVRMTRVIQDNESSSFLSYFDA